MPYDKPLTLLADSPPRGAGASSDIEDPSGNPALDPYAPYSSSSDELSDRENALGQRYEELEAELEMEMEMDESGEPAEAEESESPPVDAVGGEQGLQSAYAEETQGLSRGGRRNRSIGSAGESSGTATVAAGSAGTGSTTSPLMLTHPAPGLAGPTSTPSQQEEAAIPVLPRMTRAFSMPLPQQLKHLQHPLGRTATGLPSLYGAGYGSGSAGISDSPSVLSPSSSFSSLYDAPAVGYRDGSSTPSASGSSSGALSSDGEYLRALSLEIADSVQPIIQTLLQLSPPHILDPAKEQFSACTVQIPTASVSGLLTAMKGLNYLSARLAADGAAPAPGGRAGAGGTGGPQTVRKEAHERLKAVEAEDADEVFDIGEMLQAVGDTLAGLAAQAGVDLVLFHAEVSMLHVGVRADESAVAYLLAHVLRQVLATAEKGDTIELGLTLSNKLPRSPPLGSVGLGLPPSASSTSPIDPLSHAPPSLTHAASAPSVLPSSAPTPMPETYHCVFDIVHRLHAPTTDLPIGVSAEPSTAPNPAKDAHERGTPNLSGGVSQWLLHALGASFGPRGTEQPSPTSGGAKHYVLQVPLRQGSPLIEPPLLTPDDQLSRQPFPSYKLPSEPTLDELAQFVRSDLRSKRVALFASPSSAFARHVTSYLTSWGMDVVHVPTDGTEEAPPLGAGGKSLAAEALASPTMERELHDVLEGSSGSEADLTSTAGTSSTAPSSAGGIPPPHAEADQNTGKLSFVIIDDDVVVLRRRLVQIRKQREELREFRLGTQGARTRADKLQQTAGSPPQRPSLSGHHRPRSGPRSPNSLGDPSSLGFGSGNSPPKAGDLLSPGVSASGSSRSSSSGIFDGAVIIHFTSLANFKLVRDAVQTLLVLPPPHMQSQTYSPFVHPNLPEVIVIPKPAGPRRLLTALHTGMYKPLVDPFFAPIATSPLSPASVHPLSPFFTPPAVNEQNPLGSHPGVSSPIVTAPSPNLPASPSNHPGPLNIHMMQQHPQHGTLYLPGGYQKARSPGPSPLAQPPATVPEGDYFPEDAVKIGSSASSGVVLQSPDGRPAGVFFQPLGRTVSNTTGGGSTPPDGSAPPAPSNLNGSTGAGTRPMTLSKPSGESVQRQVPVGTIFSASQVIDTYRSPTAEGAPHLHGPRTSRRQIKRVTTGETRPFLLPGKDEELGDATTGASGGRQRSGTRRTSSASITSSIAAGVPLPPSRPGSTRIASGGSASVQGSHRLANRRLSGQIINAGAMNFVPGDAPTPAVEIPGPVSPTRAVDPDKQAQRDNIRKLIQAGVEAVPPTAIKAEVPPVLEQVLAPTPVAPGPAGIGALAGMSAITGSQHTPSPIPISPPSDHVSPVKPPPTILSLRRSSDAAISPTVKKKSVGDNVIVPPINVLIVEDNPINQTILSTFMRRKKIKYGTANDGAQAVEKWRTGGYHLILMDIQMPVMDGIEATKEIRRLESQVNIGLFPTTPPGDSLRAASPSPFGKQPGTPGSLPQSSPHRSSVIIVALTASSLQSDRVNALAAGCNDFLTKPVSLKWLEKKIIEWGSIKALQMWADSAVTRGFSSGSAARAARVRDQLRINRSGRNSPSPGPRGKDSGTDTETATGTHPRRPVAGPVPLAGTDAKETQSSTPITIPGDGACPETVHDRRTQSATTLNPYFPDPVPDVFAPNETKSLLLHDILDDEDEDSPAETIKEVSPRRTLSATPSPIAEAH